MKYILVLLLLTSCAKERVLRVHEPLNISPVTFYFLKDGVDLSFSSTGDNNVAYYEIYSGDNDNFLCIEYRLLPNKRGEYNYLSPIVKSYYMIGYKLKDSTLKFDDQLIHVKHE